MPTSGCWPPRPTSPDWPCSGSAQPPKDGRWPPEQGRPGPSTGTAPRSKARPTPGDQHNRWPPRADPGQSAGGEISQASSPSRISLFDTSHLGARWSGWPRGRQKPPLPIASGRSRPGTTGRGAAFTAASLEEGSAPSPVSDREQPVEEAAVAPQGDPQVLGGRLVVGQALLDLRALLLEQLLQLVEQFADERVGVGDGAAGLVDELTLHAVPAHAVGLGPLLRHEGGALLVTVGVAVACHRALVRGARVRGARGGSPCPDARGALVTRPDARGARVTGPHVRSARVAHARARGEVGVGPHAVRVAPQLAAVLDLTLRGGVATAADVLGSHGVAAHLATLRRLGFPEVLLLRQVLAVLRAGVDRPVVHHAVVVAAAACDVVGERVTVGGRAGSAPAVRVVVGAGRGLGRRVVEPGVTGLPDGGLVAVRVPRGGIGVHVVAVAARLVAVERVELA